MLHVYTTYIKWYEWLTIIPFIKQSVFHEFVSFVKLIILCMIYVCMTLRSLPHDQWPILYYYIATTWCICNSIGGYGDQEVSTGFRLRTAGACAPFPCKLPAGAFMGFRCTRRHFPPAYLCISPPARSAGYSLLWDLGAAFRHTLPWQRDLYKNTAIPYMAMISV